MSVVNYINIKAMGGRDPLRDRKDDIYETPECATRALLEVEKLPRKIWEPACGPGAIVRVLRAAGHEVLATDLVNFEQRGGAGLTWPGAWGVDFLMERQAPAGTEAIITNPPYKLAAQFAAHALDLAPLVIMLFPLVFYEAGNLDNEAGAARRRVLDCCPPARIHAFANRLPRMHRHDWNGKKANSARCFAWFVWHRFHQGPTIIDRIRWA